MYPPLTPDAPEELITMTAARLQRMADSVDRVAELLTGPNTQQLLLLKGSKQYAARLAQQLSLKAGQEGKCIKYVGWVVVG